MQDLSYYSKDKLFDRLSFDLKMDLKLHRYHLESENGVTRLDYKFGLKPAVAFLAGFTLIPALVYWATEEYHTPSGTHYFDTSSGKEISFKEYCENKNKNRKAEDSARRAEECARQQNYEEAYNEFTQAYAGCTRGYKNEKQYQNKRDNARIKWLNSLNQQGHDLYAQRNFLEALEKYKKAQEVCTSDMNDKKKVYIHNQANCHTALKNYSIAIQLFNQALSLDPNYEHAMNSKAHAFNNWGNYLFAQQNYNDAHEKFMEAFLGCTVNCESRQTFADNIQKCKTEIEIQSKLIELRTSWGDAWEAENAGRDDEAEQKFANVSDQAEYFTRKYPHSRKLAEIKQKVALKIERNHFFNEGIKFQNDGNKLLKDAKKLNEEKKFELALDSIERAKHKFSDSLRKFTEGQTMDERFKPCVDFVQNSLIQIEKLKVNTENKILNLITTRTNRDAQNESDDILHNELFSSVVNSLI